MPDENAIQRSLEDFMRLAMEAGTETRGTIEAKAQDAFAKLTDGWTVIETVVEGATTRAVVNCQPSTLLNACMTLLRETHPTNPTAPEDSQPTWIFPAVASKANLMSRKTRRRAKATAAAANTNAPRRTFRRFNFRRRELFDPPRLYLRSHARNPPEIGPYKGSPRSPQRNARPRIPKRCASGDSPARRAG